MTIAEAKNFYNQDERKYILNNNRQFNDYLQNTIEDGYYGYTDIKQLQQMIDNIATWYEIKYPEKELEYYEGIKYLDFEKIQKLSKEMTFEQLLFRMDNFQLNLIKCNYRAYGYGMDNLIAYSITDNTKYIYLDFKDRFLLFANSVTGLSKPPYDIEDIVGKEEIHIEEILRKLEKENDKFDLQELKQFIYFHKVDIEIRKQILQLIPLKLLYSKNTNPERGYIRAKRFIGEFNKHIPNLNLTSNEIDEIMKRDYKKEIEKEEEKKDKQVKTLIKRIFNKK